MAHKEQSRDQPTELSAGTPQHADQEVAETGSSARRNLVKTKWTKVVLAGPPGSGKSSALRLLLDEEPIDRHDSTPVVQSPKVRTVTNTMLESRTEGTGRSKTCKWTKVSSTDENPMGVESTDSAVSSECCHHFIYAVDTGGQAAFLDIAPVLVRYNSVTIVTHRLDQKLDDKTSFHYSVEGKRIGEPIKRQLTNQQVLEMTAHSLTSARPPEIHANMPGSQGSTDKPSVLVLGTFNDKEHGEPLRVKDSFLKERLANFVTLVDYRATKIFPVNTIARSDDEQKVASAIRRKVSLSYIEAEIPEEWFKFQQELNKRRKIQTSAPKSSTTDSTDGAVKTSSNVSLVATKKPSRPPLNRSKASGASKNRQPDSSVHGKNTRSNSGVLGECTTPSRSSSVAPKRKLNSSTLKNSNVSASSKLTSRATTSGTKVAGRTKTQESPVAKPKATSGTTNAETSSTAKASDPLPQQQSPVQTVVLLKKCECDEIGSKFGMSSADVTSALTYFHNLMVVLYFPEILPKMVFLDPQPLFDKLSELISVSFADGADYFEDQMIDLPPDAHDDMKSKGLFKKALLESDGFMGEELQADDFLKLLENLLIVVKLPFTDSQTDPYYFLPCVLPTTSKQHLEELKRKYMADNRVAPLVLRWSKTKVPQGLFCALVLQLLLTEIFEDFVEKDEYFRNAIQLRSELFGDLLLIDSIDYLEVYYSANPRNCYKIKQIIFEQLRRAVKRFHYQSHLSRPEKCFFSSCSRNETPCVARIWNDQNVAKKICDKCDRTFDITDYEKNWLKSPGEMSLLDERPSPRELLANVCIPDKLKVLGMLLELPRNQLNHIFQKPDDVNRHSEFFELWLRADPKPTRRKLIEALRNQSILEEKLAEEYKSNIEQKYNSDDTTEYSIDDQEFSVNEIMKYLTHCRYKMYQWFDLGKRLELSEASLQKIERKFHTSFDCLRECLSVWLEDGEGVVEKTSDALASALEFSDDGKKIAEQIRSKKSRKASIIAMKELSIDSMRNHLDAKKFKSRNWFELGRQLGLTEKSLDAIECDSNSESLTETLSLWLQTDEGTLRKTLDSLSIAVDNLQKQPHVHVQEADKVPFYTEEPDHTELVNQLSSIDYQWKELGIALGVETRHLESLSKDMQSNTVKLDSVMGFWRNKLTPPYTWATILDIISGPVINNRALRGDIEQFLRGKAMAH